MLYKISKAVFFYTQNGIPAPRKQTSAAYALAVLPSSVPNPHHQGACFSPRHPASLPGTVLHTPIHPLTSGFHLTPAQDGCISAFHTSSKKTMTTSWPLERTPKRSAPPTERAGTGRNPEKAGTSLQGQNWRTS